MQLCVCSDVPKLTVSGPVRLLDRSNGFVRWVQPGEANALIESGVVDALGTTRKIHAIRWTAAGPTHWEHTHPIPSRTPGMGGSHRRENECNPKGVWTIERVPRSLRHVFTAVLDDCKAA